MRPMTMEIHPEGSQPIALFDLSIKDIEQRRRERIVLPSIGKAYGKLGFSSRKTLQTAIRNKERVMYQGKWYAVRYEDSRWDSVPLPKS